MPKMVARSRLVGKNTSGPIWDHFRQIFPWAGKIQKTLSIFAVFLGGPMAAIQPVWSLGCNSSAAIRKIASQSSDKRTLRKYLPITGQITFSLLE